MYNRYIPQDGYSPVEHGGHSHSEPSDGNRKSSPFSFLSSLLGGGGGVLSSLLGGGGSKKEKGDEKSSGLSGLLDKIGLGRLDRGDILLLLVLIYLFRETDDDEWLIILALVLLMGL